MVDFLGQPITVGKTVVYPGRQGSRLWMNRAVILEVSANAVKVQRNDGGIRVLKCLDRVVVIQAIGEADHAEV